MADMSKVKLPDNNVYNLRDDRFIYEKSVSASNVATFSDGADNVPLKSLTLNINPTQSGSGDPYPAGGGKNKWNGKFVSQSFIENDTFTTTYCYAGNADMSVKVGVQYCGSVDGTQSSIRYVFLDANKNAIGDYVNANYTVAAPSNAVYMKWRFTMYLSTGTEKCQIEEGTTSSTWTPYSNIRPITGVSSVNVCNTPMPVAPLWNIDSLFNGHVEFNQLCNISSGSSTVNSVAISRDGNGKVTLNGTCDLASGSVNALVFPFSSSFINGHKYLVGAKGTRAKHLTVTPNGVNNYMGDFRLYNSAFNLVVAIFSGETYNNESIYPMIIDLTQMFGSTIADYIYSLEQGTAGAGVAFFRSIYPNDYYAYDTGTDEMVGSREGNTYLIQLGDTYYGGSLDVTNGVLTVTNASVDMGDLSWTYFSYTTPPHFGANVVGMIKLSPLMCEGYIPVNDAPYQNVDMTIRATDEHSLDGIKVSDTNYTDKTAFTSAVTGIKVAYQYATPTEITLPTKTQINTLLGANNIYHDANGTTACTYRVNTPLVDAIKDISPEVTIDDSKTVTDQTWSSSKISSEISSAIAGVIDDTTTDTNTTWSSGKISTELATKTEVDDATASATKTYSSNKIEDIIEAITPRTGTVTDQAIATFSDGADNVPLKSLTLNINPTQSGSGDPYPAGGGSNKWDEEYVITASMIVSKNYIPCQPNTSYYRATPNNIIVLYYDSDKTQLSTSTWGTGTFTTPNDCYFLRFQVDPAYGTTYHNNIAINYPSTVTTYSPYSNIRPITGVSSVNVCNTPMPVAPLWNIDSSFNGHVEFNQLFNINGTIGKNNGTVDVTNNVLTYTVTYKSTYQYINQTITCPQDHKFLFSIDVKLSANETVGFGDGATIYKTVAVSANTKTRINYIVNFTNARSLFYLYPARSAGLDVGETMVAENFLAIDLTQMFGSTIADYIYSLEQGTAGAGVAFFRSIYPNDYYAYDTGTDEMVGSREGNTYLIQLGDTYYGGSLDVTNGVLTVTKRCKQIPPNNLGISVSTITYVSGEMKSGNALAGICDTFKTVNSSGSYGVRFGANNTTIYFYKLMDNIPEITDLDTAKQWFTEHPVNVCYELATPIEIDLTPTQINSLLGSNNIWHDGNGETSCEYYKTGCEPIARLIESYTNKPTFFNGTLFN